MGSKLKSRVRSVRATVLFWCVGAVLALAASAEANYPGENGRITYSNGDQGGIESVNPDGTDPRSPFGYCCIGEHAWSPDGTRIAFNLFEEEGDSGLFVVNSDGSGSHALGSSSIDTWGVSWSPDGSTLAFGRLVVRPDFTSDYDIFTTNADGTGLTDITNTPNTDEWEPSWSPDGSRIAFSLCTRPRLPPGQCHIHMMRPDGALTGELTSGDQSEGAPDWSPDGSKIVFNRQPLGTLGGDIWVANADGSSQTQLTEGVQTSDPTWSPDGRKVVFGAVLSPISSAVEVMNANGSDRQSLIPFNYLEFWFTGWQPLPGPRRSDFKNLAQFCKAEREFLGESAFAQKYGANRNGANAFGKCVSASSG